jgi:ASC-1-like (ASCH) protein
MKQSILHLTLKREFFAAIAAGKKKTEYRDRKPYWKKRLEGRNYDVIQFRNGYASDAPEMLVEHRGLYETRKNGRPQYAIRLGRILRVTRWRG